MKSTSYGIVLGTFMKKLSQSFDIFVQIKKKIDILNFQIFDAFLPIRCFLYIMIYSGVTKGYRGEDKALEMNRKMVGELLVWT